MQKKGLTIIFLLCTLYSYGQKSQNIGFKGGLSFSTMTAKYTYNDIHETFNRKNGFKAGIYGALTVDLFKGQFLSLTTDLGFIQKGMTRKLPHDYVNKIKRDHLYFSPMLKGFYNFNALTIYALLGPRVDLDVSYAVMPESTMDGKSSRWLFGLSYGLGSEYRKGKFGILIECQGQPDITPSVNNDQSIFTPYDLIVKQNAFILTTGLKYYFQ